MDYCSLCQKACLGGFLKNIHRPNSVTVVEHFTSKDVRYCQVQIHSARGYLLFYCLLLPYFQRVFNESKWLPDFAEVIFVCVCVYLCDFFFSLLWKIRTLGFLRCVYMVWNVDCTALPIIDPTMTFYKFWSLVKVAILLRWTLLPFYLKHTQLVPPAFPLPLQF